MFGIREAHRTHFCQENVGVDFYFKQICHNGIQRILWCEHNTIWVKKEQTFGLVIFPSWDLVSQVNPPNSSRHIMCQCGLNPSIYLCTSFRLQQRGGWLGPSLEPHLSPFRRKYFPCSACRDLLRSHLKPLLLVPFSVSKLLNISHSLWVPAR